MWSFRSDLLINQRSYPAKVNKPVVVICLDGSQKEYLDIAPAAAMGMMILYTNAAVRIVYVLITKKILVRFQNWRKKTS